MKRIITIAIYTALILILDATFQRHYEYVQERHYTIDYLTLKWYYEEPDSIRKAN